MRFIGIDAGITTTGICILQEDDTYEPILIEAPKERVKGSDADRFRWLKDAIESAIRPGKERTMYVIEGYAFGAKGHLTRIAEFGGILKNMLCSHQRRFLDKSAHDNYHVFTCAPTTLKKFVTGSGRGEKSLILKAVYKKWNFDTDSDDLADAFGLAKICRELFFYMSVGLYGAELSYENDCIVALMKQNKINTMTLLS